MKTFKTVVTNLSTSSIGNINLYWLIWTLIIFSVTLLMENIYQLLVNINLAISLPVFHLIVLVLINWIFYKGMKHQKNLKKTLVRDQIGLDNNAHDNLGNVTEQELEDIINYINQEKPYTDLGFSLGQLAEQLEMPKRRLSQLINSYFNKNFMTFINDYRIDLAKKRLKNPIDPKETILEIMYEVGFNSKSSFNTLFKKETGLTPKEYKSKFSFSFHDN